MGAQAAVYQVRSTKSVVLGVELCIVTTQALCTFHLAGSPLGDLLCSGWEGGQLGRSGDSRVPQGRRERPGRLAALDLALRWLERWRVVSPEAIFLLGVHLDV